MNAETKIMWDIIDDYLEIKLTGDSAQRKAIIRKIMDASANNNGSITAIEGFSYSDILVIITCGRILFKQLCLLNKDNGTHSLIPVFLENTGVGTF